MKIEDLASCGQEIWHQLPGLIVEGFAGSGSDYETPEGATRPVDGAREPGVIALAALEGERAIGFVSGLPCYGGNAFELHGLVVHPDFRGRGIARGLVTELERQAARGGASLMWLGTDDENARTSIGGVDLYPDVLANLARIENLRGHPFGFYQRLGFTVVGALPDANGVGKPDILMAKRIAPAA